MGSTSHLLRSELLAGVLLLVVSGIGYFFVKLYNARKIVWEYQKRGLPVAPGHSFLFGHLLLMKETLDTLPPKCHYYYAMKEIGSKYFEKEGCYYLDTWPVGELGLINVSPQIAPQSLQTGTISLNRPNMLPRFFKPIAGGRNLFDLQEKEWRPWRAVFVKGFSPEHLSSLVPGMVKETLTYCTTLEKQAAKGSFFSLDLTTLRFTIDLIGKTVLNTSLGAQKGYNTLADCMLNQIRWHQANADLNPLSHLNFIRWYVHWSNGRRMDNYIGNLLDKRYSEIRKEIAEGAGLKTKSVIDLILQAYATTSSEGQPPIALDSEFRIFAIRQIRLFVFVGHDSTSSTICYIIHLLFGHPEILGKVRSEVAKVFGIAEEIPSKITEQQHLLNHLPYTTAVIKEAMRLFPAAAASRQGQPGYSIIDDSGQSCPTDECFVLTVHLALQRSAKYWPKPDDFIPERFLVEPGHELYPPKNGWRPFEKGPRNCMAEGLVMLELKVVLAIVLSCFDFVEAYEEYDRVQGKKGKTYKGERAYQIEEGAAHPVDGYPCKVSIRGRHGS